MKVFIIIPVYNEESRIVQLLSQLKKMPYQIIVVDDGSKDKTFEVLNKHFSQTGNITLLKHKVNLGKGAAMNTGATAAFVMGADAVIFMDGDGQHSVADLDKFVKKLKDSDVVLGEREVAKNVSYRIYGSRILSKIANTLYGVKVKDFLCGFRGITKNAYKKIKWVSTDYSVETEMIARIGRNKVKYTIVPVKSIYHDIYKGFSVTDGIKLLYNILSWKLTL